MTERNQNEHEQEMTKDTIPNRNGKMYEIYSTLSKAFQKLLSYLTHSLSELQRPVKEANNLITEILAFVEEVKQFPAQEFQDDRMRYQVKNFGTRT